MEPPHGGGRSKTSCKMSNNAACAARRSPGCPRAGWLTKTRYSPLANLAGLEPLADQLKDLELPGAKERSHIHRGRWMARDGDASVTEYVTDGGGQTFVGLRFVDDFPNVPKQRLRAREVCRATREHDAVDIGPPPGDAPEDFEAVAVRQREVEHKQIDRQRLARPDRLLHPLGRGSQLDARNGSEHADEQLEEHRLVLHHHAAKLAG
jgi:hypothetical protein